MILGLLLAVDYRVRSKTILRVVSIRTTIQRSRMFLEHLINREYNAVF